MTTTVDAVRQFIASTDKSLLLDSSFLENTLIPSLGLNNEILHEQPKELSDYFGGGLGLRIWQYPNQFSDYLLYLASVAPKISSYLEIGCRFGGTFILTCEYLKAMGAQLTHAVAVDLIDACPLMEEYTSSVDGAAFWKIDSKSSLFTELTSNTFFDLVLIDGDHSYEGVRHDSLTMQKNSNIRVFHDIVSSACPGVVRYWQEIKSDNAYDIHEFTQQYESVANTFLGIGVAESKMWTHV